jgi:pilus assembly protein CpaC
MIALVLALSMLFLSPAPDATDAGAVTSDASETETSSADAAQASDHFARMTGNDWDDFRDFSNRPKPPNAEDEQSSPESVRKELETEMVEKLPMHPTTDHAADIEPTPPPVKSAEKMQETDNAATVLETIQPLPAIGPSVVANRPQNSTLHVKNNLVGGVLRVTVDTSKTIDLPNPVDAAGITDPDVADLIVVTPTRLLLVGKAAGATQLRLRTGNDVTVHHVHVEPNTQVLQDLILSVSPTADVRVRSVKGQVVLIGRVSDVNDVARIEELATAYQGGPVINHINVAGVQQTLLRVVVAEVNKDASRSLGINWGLGGSDLSRDLFFANNLNQLNPTIYGSNGLNNVLQGQLNYSLAPTAIGPQTNFTIGFPKAELQFFLNALRENSLGRTLAEPNLVAVSGQTATFLAGGEVPIPVTQGGATAGAITIEYKEFGVRLAFTPTVLGGQLIRLHIMSEVSDAVSQAQQLNGLPLFSFRTRRVESTIECGNGQTFAMAGLLDDKIQAVSSKIPGLGDLPVLGTMFSSVDYQRSRTELVVLVTPELVAPMDPNMVPALPGSDMTEPDDFELFIQQKLRGDPDKNAPVATTPAPDTYVGRPTSPTIVATDIGIEGPWGMTGN